MITEKQMNVLREKKALGCTVMLIHFAWTHYAYHYYFHKANEQVILLLLGIGDLNVV